MPEVLINCLICNNDIDQKPLLAGDDHISQVRQENEDNNGSQSRLGLELLWKLLEADLKNGEEISLFPGEYERSTRLSGLLSSSSVNCGPLCCENCCGVLQEMLSLQRSIEDIQASLMEHLQRVKNSLLESVPDGYQEDPLKILGDADIWEQIRDQLLSYVLKPVSSMATLTLPASRRLSKTSLRSDTESGSCYSTTTTRDNVKTSLESVAKSVMTTKSVAAVPTTSSKHTASHLSPHFAVILNQHDNLPHQPRIRKRRGPIGPRKRIKHEAVTDSSVQPKEYLPCTVVLERIPAANLNELSSFEINSTPKNTPSVEPLFFAPSGGRSMRKSKLQALEFLKNFSTTKTCLIESTDQNIVESSGDEFVPSPTGPPSPASDLDNAEDSGAAYPYESESESSEKEETSTSVPVNHPGQIKHSKPMSKVSLITEDTLLYQYTLIKVSHGYTQFTCMEPECYTIFTGLSWSVLFQNVKDHIENFHLGKYITRSTLVFQCPLCPSELSLGPPLRRHLYREHQRALETVICEECLKPLRNTADTYRIHKWSHKNEQEKAATEGGPPKNILYKMNLKKLRKTKRKQEKNHTTLKIRKPAAKWNTSVTKCEHFSVIQKDLLLYKYTLLKFSYGVQLSCKEPGCTTVIEGTDYNALMKFKEHVKSSHVEKVTYATNSRECPLCECGSDPLRNGHKFRYHILKERKHTACPFMCPICFKEIQGEGQLEYHIWSHMNEDEKKSCGKPPRVLVKIHEEKLKKTEKSYFCGQCAREFKSVQFLRCHEQTHLPPEQRKQFDCPECPKKFLSAVAVRGHVERFHQTELLRFRYCPICNQQFNWRSGYVYRTHVRGHKNERPFVCEVCGKGFLNSQQFKLHTKRVHETTSERIYQCEFCEKNYTHSINLNKHRKRKHKDMMPKTSEEERLKATTLEFRPDFIGPKIAYPCEHCDKVFTLKSRLKKHSAHCF